MKYIKLFEKIDFDENDFEWEEEDNDISDGDIIIFKYDGGVESSSLIGKLVLRKNIVTLLDNDKEFDWSYSLNMSKNAILTDKDVGDIKSGKRRIRLCGNTEFITWDKLIELGIIKDGDVKFITEDNYELLMKLKKDKLDYEIH